MRCAWLYSAAVRRCSRCARRILADGQTPTAAFATSTATRTARASRPPPPSFFPSSSQAASSSRNPPIPSLTLPSFPAHPGTPTPGRSSTPSPFPSAPPTSPRQLFSQLYLPLLSTPSPSSAPTPCLSHSLLLRSSHLRPTSASGLLSLLPLGHRALTKLTALLTSELSALHAHPIHLPLLSPSSPTPHPHPRSSPHHPLSSPLPSSFHLKDRKGSSYLLQPSPHSSVTSLISPDVKSYRDLPIRLYDVGRRCRDEERPKGGLLRAREFEAADVWTFDVSEKKARESYDEVLEACRRLLQRVGVRYAVAEADAGEGGGLGAISHEVHVPAEAGDDVILTCSHCESAANRVKAMSGLPASHAQPHAKATTNLSDDNAITRWVRSLIPKGVREDVNLQYEVVKGDDLAIVLLSHDRTLNPLFVQEHMGWKECERVGGSEALRLLANAIERKTAVQVLVDVSVVAEGVDVDVEEMEGLEGVMLREREMTDEEKAAVDDIMLDFNVEEVRGQGGEVDMDLLMRKVEAMVETPKGKELMGKLKVRMDPAGNVQFGEYLDPQVTGEEERRKAGAREARERARSEEEEKLEGAVKQIDQPKQGHFHTAMAGDRCLTSACHGTLQEMRGIEVAHAIHLSTLYSQPLQAAFKSSKGDLKPIDMTWTGIGLTRLLAAVVEASHDAHGIVWPAAIAPYQVAILPALPAGSTLHASKSPSSAVTVAERVYDAVSAAPMFAGDVLLDDRVEVGLGQRVKEVQLMGVPWIVHVGSRAAQEGQVEVEVRRSGEKRAVRIDDLVDTLQQLRRHEDEAGWFRAQGKRMPSRPPATPSEAAQQANT